MSHSKNPMSPARFARIESDGRTLLANLDIDGVLPPEGVDLTRLLDGLNDVIDGPEDLPELLRLAVQATAPGQDLFVRLAPGDARLVRLFRSDGDGGWVRVVGAAADPSAESVEAPLPLDASGRAELRAEAVTLRGAPGFASRSSVEVRITDGSADHDSVRLTIAPFLLLSNLHEAERIYIAYSAEKTDNGTHPMAEDLAEALRLAYDEKAAPEGGDPGGFTPGEHGLLHLIDARGFPPDCFPQDEFEIGHCGTADLGMRVAVHNPRGKGDTGLYRWVRTELPRHNVGLFDDLAARLPIDSTEYGGNLEVSGPVMKATPQQDAGLAGPAVPPQDVAPHGKILIGECRRHVFTLPASLAPDLDGGGSARVWRAFEDESYRLRRTMRVTVISPGARWRVEDQAPDVSVRWPVSRVFEIDSEPEGLRVSYTRSVSPAYRAFLDAQGGVQPILPLDTSWLHVGHVDELLSVVPGDGPTHFRLLMASPERALTLLDRALFHEQEQGFGLTRMLRGQRPARWDPDRRGRVAGRRGRAGQVLGRTVAEMLEVARNPNMELDTVIDAIEQRLIHGLGLQDDDQLIRLPVLFVDVNLQPDKLGLRDDSRPQLTARTPNLANALVLDRNVFLPRPVGPRMSPEGVALVLQDLGVPALTEAQLERLTNQRHWIREQTYVDEVAAAFGVSEQDLLDTGQFPDGVIADGWQRIWIPGGDVDVFEAYTAGALAEHDLTAYFVDTWTPFHTGEGEVHCGTNVMRKP